MTNLGNRYVLISPVRNEEKFLQQTIDCILNQTVKPVEYLLVDDGSTDRTPAIIQAAVEKFPWIRYLRRPDRGTRQVGPGVVEAFYDGLDSLKTHDYDFIGKIDGDVSFGNKYYETLLDEFSKDSFLGNASGKIFLKLNNNHCVEERHADDMVVGAMQFYRRECFEQIGGFVKEVMWDGIAFHRCRMEGWRTQSFRDPNLTIYEHRMMGSSDRSVFHGRLRWGWGQYFMGTHPLYILAIGVYRALERPFVIGGILIISGYFWAMLKKRPRYDLPNFRTSLHAWQFERLGLGKRLEVIPSPNSPSPTHREQAAPL